VSADWPVAAPRAWRGFSSVGFVPFDADHPPPDVTVAAGERAGVRSQESGASSGPTGAPWIDSNGWLIRLTRFRKPAAEVWVTTPPFKDNEVVPLESYLVAIADAAAFGGRWVLTPDPRLARGVAGGAPEALRDWERIAHAVRFFAARPAAGEEVRANLGIVSDFTGENETFARELLNLAERRHAAYRLIGKASPGSAALGGLRAVLLADSQAPSPAWRKRLEDFAASGGLVIAGPKWGAPSGPPAPGEPLPRFDVRLHGRGRIAIGREMDDPFLVAADAQVLISHRHDPIRLWNGGAWLARVTGPPDGSRLTVQLVNYTGAPPNNAVTIEVAGAFRSARLTTFEAGGPQTLRLLPRAGFVELRLPPLGVYAAIELG